MMQVAAPGSRKQIPKATAFGRQPHPGGSRGQASAPHTTGRTWRTPGPASPLRPQCALREMGREAARTSSEAPRGGQPLPRGRGHRDRALKPSDTVTPPGRSNPLPPRPGRPSARTARSPYHTTRRDSSKNPGKTRSSLAIAQRRPKSTIPGMAEAPLPERAGGYSEPRALRDPTPNRLRLGAGAREGRARRRRTEPHEAAGPPRLRRGADPEGAGWPGRCFPRVRRQF